MTGYSMIVAFCHELGPKTQRANRGWSLYALWQRPSLTLSHLAQPVPAPAQPKVNSAKHSLWQRRKRLYRVCPTCTWRLSRW